MNFKKERKNKRILVICGVALATVVTLAGCGKADVNVKVYDKEDETKEILNGIVSYVGNDINNEVSNQTENQITTNIKKDSTKEIVYDLVNDAKEWTKVSEYSGREIKYSYSYRIPQINIDSEDANKLNQEIQDEYLKEYNEMKEAFNKYGNPGGCWKIEYAYHINGDVVSIVMASFWDGDSVQRTAYNIDAKTGKEVTNAELLNKKGITESEFPSKLSNILTEELKEMYTPSEEQLSYRGSSPIEFYNNQYKKTTSLENCSVDNDMYLNKNGQLCVIAKRYNIAGGESTKIIVNIDTAQIYVME